MTHGCTTRFDSGAAPVASRVGRHHINRVTLAARSRRDDDLQRAIGRDVANTGVAAGERHSDRVHQVRAASRGRTGRTGGTGSGSNAAATHAARRNGPRRVRASHVDIAGVHLQVNNRSRDTRPVANSGHPQDRVSDLHPPDGQRTTRTGFLSGQDGHEVTVQTAGVRDRRRSCFCSSVGPAKYHRARSRVAEDGVDEPEADRGARSEPVPFSQSRVRSI